MSKKKERKEAWARILVLIVSGIIIHAWAYLSYVLIVINWIATLINGKRHKGIAEFVEYWNTQMYKFFRYLSGVSNERPFPFSDLNRISKYEEEI